jgi:hypothetical protein
MEDLDKMLNMNLKTNFLIARQLSEGVLMAEQGCLCFTSAMSGFNPEKGKLPMGYQKAH